MVQQVLDKSAVPEPELLPESGQEQVLGQEQPDSSARLPGQIQVVARSLLTLEPCRSDTQRARKQEPRTSGKQQHLWRSASRLANQHRVQRM